MRRFLKRQKEDSGAANTVSFIVIMLFVMTLLISFIDIGVYFNTKNEMESAVENGARNVALYGGTEGGLRDAREKVSSPIDIVDRSIASNYEAEAHKTKIVEYDPKNITCSVENYNGTDISQAEQAGDKVECELTYKYNGLAGNFSLFNLGRNDDVVVRGSSVSEVGYGEN